MINQEQEKSIFISLRLKLLIGFTLLFTIVFALAFIWFYNFAADMALKRIQEDVLFTLQGATEGVDADAFAALAEEVQLEEPGYPEDPRYWDHVSWLYAVNTIEPRAFLYTYIQDPENPEKVIFIGSHGAMIDPPEGAPYYYRYDPSEEMLNSFNEVTFRNDFQAYEDEWGRWVSVYAPLRDSAGDVVGGLGVDFQADYVFQVRETIRNTVWAAFAIVYIVLFVLVWFLTQSLTRPVIKLTEIAERVGEGDYNVDFEGLHKGKLRDEISSLAQTIESMTTKIYKRERDLRRQVEELRIEIDETKRASQLEEIVETDFFRDLQSKAKHMRNRRTKSNNDEEA